MATAVAAAMLALATTESLLPVTAAADVRYGAFEEVARLPILLGSGDSQITEGDAAASGWLIINRKQRRLYQISETGFSRTVVQSFNLDTLQPVRRQVFKGAPVVAGPQAYLSSGATAGRSAEIVHAVDEEAGRLYFALYDPLRSAPNNSYSYFTTSSDANRPVTRFVAVDEARFAAGEPDFAASFAPATPTWLRSLVVDRVHGENTHMGRLMVVGTNVLSSGNRTPSLHRIEQWDVSGLRMTAGAEDDIPPGSTPPPLAAAPIVLTACGSTSMTAGGGYTGSHQWGVLVRKGGLFLGCQGSADSARAVYVPLDDDGAPRAGEPQLAYPLSRPVSDVLVDPGGEGRLLFRAYNNGHTWWVFDTSLRRFVGAIAAALTDTPLMATGLDEETGRLYSLIPDYVTNDQRTGRVVPVRGGLFTSDVRLDPVPPFDNVAPELAYPAFARIKVDERTGRIFVRRGSPASNGVRIVYPGTSPTAPAPVENFYLVLRDTRPASVAQNEGAEDDRRFTTNVAEAPGVTKASFLGTGAGYGVRNLLIGGSDAATGRPPWPAVGSPTAPCDKDDRELLTGAVESTAVSDVSASAAAASLAGDSRTEEQAGELRRQCVAIGSSTTTEQMNEAAPAAADTVTLRFDGPDKDESSDFRTQCVGDVPEAKATPRGGFRAKVTCAQDKNHVLATSEGSLGGLLGDTSVLPVTVGYAHSNVDIQRKPEGGVVVTVDAVARGIEIAGVGRIGVVRTTATSEAAGRDGSARTRFQREICGVDLQTPRMVTADCLSERTQTALADAVNETFTGRLTMRLRQPEASLAAGSRSGYRAAVQREAVDLFQDRFITRDTSLAVPGLELVFYQGDDAAKGAGRQIVQLAGAQAGTSYGIACLHGEGPKGCATGTEPYEVPPEPPGYTVDGEGNLVASGDGGDTAGRDDGRPRREGLLERIAKAPLRLAADVLRLLFSSPREFALMATVWALLYLPCYLGERRRALARLAARRSLAEGVA